MEIKAEYPLSKKMVEWLAIPENMAAFERLLQHNLGEALRTASREYADEIIRELTGK